MILPLANRILARLDFDSDAPASGPNWRDPDTAEGAIGHAVSVGRDEYVCTDGNDGLKLIHWAEPKLVETKSRLVRLPRRITAAPVVIPPERDGSPPRLCVADAGDALTLLDAWSLTALRTWHLPGKITTGPFVRGQALACIVDKNLLVWIDPDKEQPLWEYAFTTDIVGAPLLLNDMVIVADLAGHIDALDPAKGQPLAKGYTLSANVAPATGPLPFTEDRVFLPLTDGTVMLLSRGVLR